MRVLLQRVTSAQVEVAGETVGAIGTGLLALVGVTHGDSATVARSLARKVYGLRILRDERSIADHASAAAGAGAAGAGAAGAGAAGAAVLVVSQFTLYGDARKGRRPTWAAAAPGAEAEPLVYAFVTALRDLGATVATGVFGADMRVTLVNDGPVTLLLEM